MSAALRRSFSSLSVPNYRRFFAGQVVSVSGNWMQMVAEGWLVLTLTGSGVAVGVATAMQFVPLLLFGAFGGLLADRFDKRRLLMVTQSAMAIPALFLFAVTVGGIVTPAMVFATAFARGMVNALDNPARQSFAIEMVGADRIVNAVSLNSVVIHSSRILGPAIAGAVIALWGIGPCFGLNALSFIAMLVALAGMAPDELRQPRPAAREPGAIRASLRYVAGTRELLVPLVLMALVGMLGFNFQVVLPLLARFTFGGDASTYALLLSAMAVGSVAGALINGARGSADMRLIGSAALAFGVLAALAAAAPSLLLLIAVLVPLGVATVTFAASINSHLQLVVEPAMRGRVMALYSVVFLGSTPIGAPIAGWLSEVWSPRAGLALAGLAALVAAAIARRALARVGADQPIHLDRDKLDVGGAEPIVAGAAAEAEADIAGRGHEADERDLVPGSLEPEAGLHGRRLRRVRVARGTQPDCVDPAGGEVAIVAEQRRLRQHDVATGVDRAAGDRPIAARGDR